MKRRVQRILGLIGGVLVVLLLTALVTGWTYANSRLARALERFETTVGPWVSEETSPPDLEPFENAARWYTAAGRALILSPSHQEVMGRATSTPTREWDEKLQDEARELLRNSEPTRMLLERAAGLEGSSYDLRHRTGDTDPSALLTEALRASRLNGVEARLRLVEGDLEEAVSRIVQSSRIAVSLRRESQLLAMLIANAVETGLLNLILDVLPQVDAPLLEVLEGALQDLDAATGSLAEVLAAEGAQASRQLKDDPIYQLDRSWGPLRRFLVGWQMPLAEAALLEAYSDLVGAAPLPYEELVRSVEAPSRESSLPLTRVFRSAVVPNLYSAAERYQATISARQLARTSLALRLWAQEHDGYPPDLAAAALQPKPSPYTLEAMAYERGGDGTAVLAYPDAQALWEQNNSNRATTGPPLSWALPPTGC